MTRAERIEQLKRLVRHKRQLLASAELKARDYRERIKDLEAQLAALESEDKNVP